MIGAWHAFYLLTIQNIGEMTNEYSQDTGSRFLFHAGVCRSCARANRFELKAMPNCPRLFRAIFLQSRSCVLLQFY